MQNYCKTIGALAAASALAAGNASAIEIDYELSAGYSSEYLFRGFNLGKGLVDVGLDASTELNGFGLNAGAWYGSFRSQDISFDELDLYGEVSRDLGFATAAVGYIFYNNANLGGVVIDDAQELYFSLARDFGFFDAALTYYWDIETDNDGYLELALSNATELSSCLTLNSGVAFGYQTEKGKLGHITASVALDYALTETATVSPFVAHSWSTSENGIYAGTKNEFVGGARVAVSF